jgi:hypothetical protein
VRFRCPRFPPGFWAVTWEPRRYVLAQVSVKTRCEPGAPEARSREEKSGTTSLPRPTRIGPPFLDDGELNAERVLNGIDRFEGGTPQPVAYSNVAPFATLDWGF